MADPAASSTRQAVFSMSIRGGENIAADIAASPFDIERHRNQPRGRAAARSDTMLKAVGLEGDPHLTPRRRLDVRGSRVADYGARSPRRESRRPALSSGLSALAATTITA